VTTRCPDGHDSTDAEYCSECGLEMAPTGAAVVAAPVPAPAGGARLAEEGEEAEEEVHTDTIVAGNAKCPRCLEPMAPGDRFCEGCGHDATIPWPPDGASSDPGAAEVQWTVIVRADRAVWESLGDPTMHFPAGCVERTIVLEGDEVLVGRSNPEQANHPEIDLGGDYDDPAVSRRHARLCRGTDATWTVTDLDSSNGTWYNDHDAPIPPGRPVALADGDRLQIGAFTVLEFRRA
jgi:hypothetical protein